MKLIIAILHDQDQDQVSHALTSAGLRVTAVASSGGFLRKGQTTLLIGVEDEQLETGLSIIRENVKPAPVPEAKRATIFVIKVDQYLQY
ncbi:MAG: hypothetical protein HGA86_08355 [Anaerolineaceae bacterium]|nr:hypothetical protein [Anaerolineaceae bacterium]